MRFKKYLIEKYENSKHALTYQKLLMALDTAHVTNGTNMYEFNLGSVVKDSSLKGLHVRIQKGDDYEVKLGKHADGRYILVVFVGELPERLEIDTMFSTNKTLMNKFIQCVQEYSDNFSAESGDVSKTRQERQHELTDGTAFEDNYDKLVAAIDGKVAEYKAAVKELESKAKYTVNVVTKATAEAAKEQLKDDYFGQTDGEFVKKMYKLPEASFVADLDKDAQKKLTKRLENYYDQAF